MRFFSIAFLLLLSAVADASHDIPAVDELVSSVMSSLAAYTEFATATATPVAATAAVNSTKHGPASPVAVADAPYWLASIAHQGVAAFNPNPAGYKVFRNVKDYGAKGMSSSCHREGLTV